MAPIAPDNPRHAPIGSGRPASSLRLSGLIGARNEEQPRLSGVRPGDTWTPEMHAGFAGSSQELVPKCGISFLAETGRDRSRWVEIARAVSSLRLELSRAISTRRGIRLGLSRSGRQEIGPNVFSPRQGILRRNKCNKRDNAMFARVFCDFEVCTKACTQG